jgi:hypothetical protein
VRNKTLYGVCLFLALAIVFVLQTVANAQGIDLPFVGLVSPLIASMFIVPLLLAPLAAVNKYILAWRKARGRDIEAEEKHEFDDAGIISLRPRQRHEHSSTYRRFGDDD